jgi:predicted RND superfamily exporter protein
MLLGFCLAVGGVATAGMVRLQFEGAIDRFIPKTETVLEDTRDARTTFHQGDPIAVAVLANEADALLRADVLQSIVSVTERVNRIPGIDVARTQSLSTEPFVRGSVDGLDASPLVPSRKLGEEDVAAIRAQLPDASLYKGRLFANDLHGYVVLAYMVPGYAGEAPYRVVRDALADLELPAGTTLHITGLAVVIGYMAEYIQHDTLWINALAGLIVGVTLLAMVRRARGVLLVMGILQLTIGTTIGLMCWLGVPIFVITNSLPAILLALSVAESVHFMLTAYGRRRDEPGETDAQVIEYTLHKMWTPLLMITLTTGAGFASISLTTTTPPIQQFGWFAAFGVTMAWMFSTILMPIGLLHNLKHTKPMARESLHAELKIARALLDKPWIPVIAFGVGVAIMALGLPRLTVNEMAMNNFAKDSPIARADEAFNRSFDGTFTYYLDVRMPPGVAATSPQGVAAIERLEALMHDAGIESTLSVVDIARWIQDRAKGRLGNDVDAMEQILFLYTLQKGAGALDPFVTHDRSRALIHGLYRTDDQRITEPMVARLREATRPLEAQGFVIKHTDQLPMAASWIRPLLHSTFWSTMLDLVVIALSLAICYRRRREVLLVLTPVMGAVVGVYGMMGLTGIWLDVATSLFGAIAIGIGVDFSIHILHALEDHERQGLAGMDLAVAALASVIRPLTINAASLLAGFSSVAVSVVPPLRKFAVVLDSGILLAFFIAIFLVPIFYAGLLRRKAPVGAPLPEVIS